MNTRTTLTLAALAAITLTACVPQDPDTTPTTSTPAFGGTGQRSRGCTPRAYVPAMGSTTSKRPPRGRARALQPETAAKQLRCMDMAIRGLTYDEIAAAEGYADHSGARFAVTRAFERAFDAAADQLRPVYQGRAELLFRHGLTLLEEGLDTGEDADGNPIPQDLDKVRVGAAIADKALLRLMRLSGLDQPQVTVQVGGGDLESLKRDFLAFLGRAGVGAAIDAEVVEEEP